MEARVVSPDDSPRRRRDRRGKRNGLDVGEQISEPRYTQVVQMTEVHSSDFLRVLRASAVNREFSVSGAFAK
jgi:hypothetical protein